MKSEKSELSKRGLRAAFVFVVVSSCLCAAQAKFTLEQVMSSPFPSNLTPAKAAPRIAWVFDSRGARNVWVADAPDFKARQVTHYTFDDGMPLASLHLTPDGRIAVYARGSETNSRGEVADPTSNVNQPKQQVWAVDVDKGEPRLLGDMQCSEEGCEDIQISPDGQFALWPARRQLWVAPVSGAQPAHQLAYVRGDNEQPKWSPDGKLIAFRSNRGDHSLIAIYDFGGQTLHYMAPSVDRDSLPRWSPDGKQIAFVRRPGAQQKLPAIPQRPEPWAIWIGDPQTGAAHELWRSGNDLNSSFPSLTEDDNLHFAAGRIVFGSEQDGRNHLYSIALAGGQPTLLTTGDFDVKDTELSGDKRSILYNSNQGDVDRRHIWRIGVEGGKPVELTPGEGIEWNMIETSGGDIVFLGSTATTPAMPYRLTKSGRDMIAREALPADFPSSELVTPKQVIFKSEDGWEIHGQLFMPRGRTGPGPALVFMHGGSMRQMMLGFHPMQYYHNAYAENQYLTSLGYVVLSVNYRTGIMYGRTFREPKDGGWRGAAEYKDIVAAGKYLQSLSTVDPKKIGLWGGSYGGYLTAMGLARNSDIFAAGVDLHGVHDWSVLISRRQERAGDGSAPSDAAEAAKLAFQSSPNASIATWKSPVLLIQGDDDRNVPFSQTVDLAQRLREQHVPFEQLVFPDEIHDFLLWHNWVRAYAATADFFDRVLKKGERIPTP